MTCSRRTWSPESAEDDTFRPDFRRIERREVRFPDDELEGLEQPVTSQVFFYANDVDTHRHHAHLDLVGSDAAVDAADVAVDRERSATPCHGAAARLLADDEVFVFVVTSFYTIFRGSLCLCRNYLKD